MAMDFQNDDTKLNDVVKFCINYSMKNDGLVLYEVCMDDAELYLEDLIRQICAFIEKSNNLSCTKRVQKSITILQPSRKIPLFR
jgi:hypothetical protein